MSERSTILVVDNYDSFVYNLVQYVQELGAEVDVRRNDDVYVGEVSKDDFAGVLISPGPGFPATAGNSLAIIKHCAKIQMPLLGVCLGHQAIGEAFGGRVVHAPELFHGRSSRVNHGDVGVFKGVANPVIAGRYHSLVVETETLPDELEVTAQCGDLIMGLRHRTAPIEGVQFHPESVLTQDGYLIVGNWLENCGVKGASVRAKELSRQQDLQRSSLPTPSQ
jgi:para-aminobenzoate synthetase component 2